MQPCNIPVLKNKLSDQPEESKVVKSTSRDSVPVLGMTSRQVAWLIVKSRQVFDRRIISKVVWVAPLACLSSTTCSGDFVNIEATDLLLTAEKVSQFIDSIDYRSKFNKLITCILKNQLITWKSRARNLKFTAKFLKKEIIFLTSYSG